ncbi:hypothetical protein AAE478_006846 [Parahypoxylon ruwenzoriense]
MPGKSWIQVVKGRRLSKNKKVESKSRESVQPFSYSTVPLYVQQRNAEKNLEKHTSGATTPRTIRLLRLLPARSDGLLACHIHTVELDGAQTPSYDALSYTWGPTTQDEIKNGMNDERHRIIACNNRWLLVTENLFNCLKQLEKNRHYQRDLWIDAICMNQDDNDECGQQVGIMAEIYRSAQRVIIWLGTADRFTRAAWELINSLGQLSMGDLSSIIPLASDNKHNAELLGHSNSPEHWRALALLFGRTWFTRAWVVQEFVLAQNTTVFCGDYTFDWEGMATVSDLMATQTSTNTFKGPLFADLSMTSLSYKNPAKIAQMKKDFLREESSVLLHSLIRCRTYEASKDHDKVYSLLGLQSQDYSNYLVPDYNKSVAELYTDVAKYILETSDNLHILAHAEGDRFRQVSGLPTWVPDWSVKEDLGLRITGYKRYKAAGELPCFKKTHVGNSLIVRGFELDTISRVGDTKKEVNRSKNCADWLDLLDELEREHPSGNHRDAFWRTLLIDTGPRGKVPIKEPWEDAFYVWMGLCLREPSYLEKKRADEFETSFTHSPNLQLFRTARGHMGCGSLSCEKGDSIWIVQGSRVPLILRPAMQDTDHGDVRYNLVGGTYLHGFMQGEALLDGREFHHVTLV